MSLKHMLDFKGRSLSFSCPVRDTINERRNDVYRELSRRYDIRCATSSELVEIASRLYHEREIDGFDHAALTSGAGSRGMNAAMGAHCAGKGAVRQDWLEVFNSRMRHSHRERNMSAYLHDKHLLHVLNRLK